MSDMFRYTDFPDEPAQFENRENEMETWIGLAMSYFVELAKGAKNDRYQEMVDWALEMNIAPQMGLPKKSHPLPRPRSYADEQIWVDHENEVTANMRWYRDLKGYTILVDEKPIVSHPNLHLALNLAYHEWVWSNKRRD